MNNFVSARYTDYEYVIYFRSIMATEDNDLDDCCLCGEPIKKAAKQHLFFYGEKERTLKFAYHDKCFKCTVCHIPLSIRSYFLSPRNKIYCLEHYDFECPSSHSNFIRELRKFKERSIENLHSTNICKSSASSPRESQEEIDTENITCDCTNGELVLYNIGYWIECSCPTCPFFNCYSQFCHVNDFDVEEWGNTASVFEFKIDHYEEEIYEVCFLNQKHYNFYSVDELVGPIVLSLKLEMLKQKEFFR